MCTRPSLAVSRVQAKKLEVSLVNFLTSGIAWIPPHSYFYIFTTIEGRITRICMVRAAQASPDSVGLGVRRTGYGRKFSGARGQPLTRGPEDDETKTMTVARPQHVCMPLSERRQHHPARSTCAAAPNVRSSPLGADTVCKSGNSFADALCTQGLMALMQPSICCVRAQSAREFVTEFSGGATPHRSGMAQS